MLEKFINILLNNRIKIVVSILFVSILLISQILRMRADFSVQYWFRSDSNLIEELKNFENSFGTEKNIILIIDHDNSVISKDGLNSIDFFSESLLSDKDIIDVRSITHYNTVFAENDDIVIAPLVDRERINDLSQDELFDISKRAVEDKILRNYLLTNDLKTTLIFGLLRPTFDDSERGQIDNTALVERVIKLVDENRFNGVTVRISGSSKFQHQFQKISEKDLKVITPAMLLLVVIFIFGSFRTFESVLVSMSIIGVCIGTTFGIGGLFGIRFENLVSAVPGILFAICIADSVHVLVSYYRFRNLGQSTREAIKSSLRKNFIPTLLTSITTSIGFFSLTTSDLIPIRNLGLLAGIGALLAWFFTLTLIPCLFDLFQRYETYKKKDQSIKELNLRRQVNKIKNLRWPLSLFLIFFTVLCVYMAFQNKINSNPRDYIPEEMEIRKSTKYMTDRFGGITAPEIVIDSGVENGVKNPQFLAKVERLEQWLLSHSKVSKVLSSLDFIKQSYQVLQRGNPEFYKIPDNQKTIAEIFFLLGLSSSSVETFSDRVTANYQKLRMTAFWDIPNSSDAVEMYNKIQDKADELGLKIVITGNSSLGTQMNGLIVNTFINSMGLALVLIFIVLCFLFKSIRLGLFSMLPNILPVIFGTALMSLIGHNLEAGAVMVCCVCLGVAVDDTIHFMVNYIRNIQNGMTQFEAIHEVISHTGLALVVTTLILIVGFGVFVFADFIPNIRFGAYSAVVLFLALVVDLIFLPALIFLKKR